MEPDVGQDLRLVGPGPIVDGEAFVLKNKFKKKLKNNNLFPKKNNISTPPPLQVPNLIRLGCRLKDPLRGGDPDGGDVVGEVVGEDAS